MKNGAIKNNLLLLVLLSTLLNACIQPEEDTDEMAIISGSLGSNSSESLSAKLGAKVSSNSVSDYVIYCVTFDESPYSAQVNVDSAGGFALQMPLSRPFGCFINDAATNSPVASIVIQDSSSGFSGGNSSSMEVSSNLDLGEISFDAESNTATVPRDRIEAHLAPSDASGINLADLHNTSYTMSCISTGHSDLDAACNNMMNDGNSVFFRIMTATDVDNNTVSGLGVWRSEATFQRCGSIDMTDTEKTSIEAEDSISFSQLTTAADYTVDSTLCPLRETDESSSMDNLEHYYAANKLIENSSGYEFYTEDERDMGNGCVRHDVTAVSFRPATTDSDLVGHFYQSETWEESVDGACGSNVNVQASFVVKFDKQ